MIRVVTQPLRSSPTETPPSPSPSSSSSSLNATPPLSPSSPPIYCGSRPSRARATTFLSPSSLPRATSTGLPHRGGPAMQISFSPRASVLYGAVSPPSLRALPPLRDRLLFPPIVPSPVLLLLLLPPPPSPAPAPCHSFVVLSYVASLCFSPPRFISVPLCPSVFLFSAPFLRVAHPLRLPHFHRAHTSSSTSTSSPPPSTLRAATPPPPPSRPIQSPPRHPSFTASVAAYRLSFCHCGLFDILSTAVRAEARLSRGRREILETNDGGRKKSRTWEPILAPASRGFLTFAPGRAGHLSPADTATSTSRLERDAPRYDTKRADFNHSSANDVNKSPGI